VTPSSRAAVVLSQTVVAQLSSVPWLRACGRPGDERELRVALVATADEAVAQTLSAEWADIRTEAQGDLTGYLASRNPEVYGGTWNSLAAQAHDRVWQDVIPSVRAGLAFARLSDRLIPEVALDVERIVLQGSYAARVGGVPSFFADLLAVYRSGRLPCGWRVGTQPVANGHFIAF
jgi:hypothetical protein